MKTIRLVSVVTTLAGSLALCAAPVHGADDGSGFYVGVSGGYAHNSFNEDQMTAALRRRGHNVNVSSDGGDLTATLFGGITLSPTVAAEFGLGALGEFDIRISGTSSASPAVLASDIAQEMPQTGGYASYAVLRMRSLLSQRLSLNARLGPYLYWRENDIRIGGTGFRPTTPEPVCWWVSVSASPLPIVGC